MKHIITFILAAFLAFMGSAFAQQAMPGPGPIPGCPLTGCTFTGAVLTPNPIDVYDNFSGPANTPLSGVGVVPVLVHAIQEQQKEIADLKARLH